MASEVQINYSGTDELTSTCDASGMIASGKLNLTLSNGVTITAKVDPSVEAARFQGKGTWRY
ncbi:hypothetical protein N7471_001540 [Penicillium samsonianum]|uniref:uncharacterized protein n=1 Tax=Penicillium samsonianum TaxID=1882272 RepID=UPI0025469AE4|nr:uncharacterized protein N7471_001540 [Penicillium samsonianum]KAJ6150341.1 hypothetical protein N7471_001540 [Penicillium samsonianum]